MTFWFEKASWSHVRQTQNISIHTMVFATDTILSAVVTVVSGLGKMICITQTMVPILKIILCANEKTGGGIRQVIALIYIVPTVLDWAPQTEYYMHAEDLMRIACMKVVPAWVALLSVSGILPPGAARAGNEVLGEIHLIPSGNTDKLAGVWVDGQYVGYVGELKGSKKLLLMPGEHQLGCRYSGYRELSQKVLVEPGKKLDVRIHLVKETEVQSSQETSEIRLEVKPDRAAVFLNGGYVGHVDEFNGPGQAMIVPTGSYDLKITLPGYLPFETQISLRPGQKLEVKTNLIPGSIRDAGPLIDRKPTPAP